MMHRRIPLAFCLMLAPLAGCQLITASITSISDSVAGSVAAITGSIESISRSSGSPPDAAASAAYLRDVRAWTREFERAPGSQEDFLRGIGRVAERHGLTDWEAQPATLVAIGQGLKDAGWSDAQMRDLRERLAAVPPAAVESVFEGYRGAGS
jgi:hypothetical protein